MPKREKGQATDMMRAGRGMSHGQITDLSAGFMVNKGTIPFSLFIIEKASKSTDPVILECEGWLGDGYYPCPFTPNCWDVPLLRRIKPAAISLDTYDVYWSAGADASIDD